MGFCDFISLFFFFHTFFDSSIEMRYHTLERLSNTWSDQKIPHCTSYFQMCVWKWGKTKKKLKVRTQMNWSGKIHHNTKLTQVPVSKTNFFYTGALHSSGSEWSNVLWRHPKLMYQNRREQSLTRIRNLLFFTICNISL